VSETVYMDRGPHGRFAAGNAGGPGRPRRVTEADYLRALTEACSLDLWRSIVERAVKDALAGDARSRDWLGKYLLGTGALAEAAANEPMSVSEAMAQIDELHETLRLRALAAGRVDPSDHPERLA
jgi:hypothetical protein